MSHRLVQKFTLDFYSEKSRIQSIVHWKNLDPAPTLDPRLEPGCTVYESIITCFRMPIHGNTSATSPDEPSTVGTASLVVIVTVCDGFRVRMFALEVSGYDKLTQQLYPSHVCRTLTGCVAKSLMGNVFIMLKFSTET